MIRHGEQFEHIIWERLEIRRVHLAGALAEVILRVLVVCGVEGVPMAPVVGVDNSCTCMSRDNKGRESPYSHTTSKTANINLPEVVSIELNAVVSTVDTPVLYNTAISSLLWVQYNDNVMTM